jgi:hypothetical protein
MVIIFCMHNNKMDRHGMQAVIFWCQGTQDETSLKMDKHGHFDCAADTQAKG